MKSSNIGGQAVMEGIMMRHGDIYSVAVRKPDREIEVKTEDYKSVLKNKRLLRLPIIRGVFNFIDSLVVGTKCLMYSATFFEDEEEEKREEQECSPEEQERRVAKKAKEDSVLMTVTVRSDFRRAFHGASLSDRQPASECRCDGDRNHFGGGSGEDHIVFALYGADLQDEGYPESVYVSRRRAQVYQLRGTGDASDC